MAVSQGQIYIEVLDDITAGAGGATADGYEDNQVCVNATDGNLYVAVSGAWVLVATQT